MASFDKTFADNVSERAAIHLATVNVLRRQLFQEELAEFASPAQEFEFVCMERPLADAPLHAFLHVPVVMGNDPASILRPMLPAAFASAVTLHDILAEEILRSNGLNVPWRFKEKLALAKKEQPPLPATLQLSPAEGDTFWELFDAAVKVRNAIAHAKPIQMSAQDEILGERGKVLMTRGEQRAYASLTAVWTAWAAGEIDARQHGPARASCRTALAQLARLHGTSTFAPELYVRGAVRLSTPGSGGPATIDVRLLRDRVSALRQGQRCEIELTIHLGDQRYVVPTGELPQDVLVLDPASADASRWRLP